MITINSIEFTGLQRFKRPLAWRTAKVNAAVSQWGILYAKQIQERFDKFSRGGGNWPKLAKSTLERKRRLGLSLQILQETKLLRQNLYVSIAGFKNVRKTTGRVTARIVVGQGASYPNGKTVEQIIGYHQSGGPNLPRRTVLVGITPATRSKMAAVMKAAYAADVKT